MNNVGVVLCLLHMKKFIITLICFIVCVIPGFAHAEQIGFPEKSIWYSSEEFKVGENVTIYTLVVNGEQLALSGTVRFYDRDVILGEKKVTLEKNDAQVVGLAWKVTEGEHQFSAQFLQATLTESDGKKVTVVPSSPETDKDTVYVKKTVAVKDVNSENSSALAAQATLNKDLIVGEVSKATDYLKDKTPDNVEAKVSATTANIESLRETWEENFTQKRKDEQASLDALNVYYEERLKAKEEADPDNYVKQSYVDSSGENILKKPMHYVLIFFYSLIAFIVGNALIFYGLSVLVLFLIIRAIWRAVKG